MKRAGPWLLIALVLGCSKPSESTDAKRTPKPPPAASSSGASASLRIDVEIDGAPAAPIDAAKLAATKPDWQEEEHKVWKLVTLLGPAADRPGAVIAATGEQGITITLRRPTQPSDPIPALSMNRRGDVMIEMVRPDDPMPDWHGRGGRLNRPGDPLPRVAGVTKVRVVVGDAAP